MKPWQSPRSLAPPARQLEVDIVVGEDETVLHVLGHVVEGGVDVGGGEVGGRFGGEGGGGRHGDL